SIPVPAPARAAWRYRRIRRLPAQRYIQRRHRKTSAPPGRGFAAAARGRGASAPAGRAAHAGYLGSPLRFPPDPRDGVLEEWIRSTHAHYWHPAGTCRMGSDPAKGAVVDARGRVYGVRGLRVADASVFQRLPRATPALPTAVV